MSEKIKHKKSGKEKLMIGISVTIMAISLVAVALVFAWNSRIFQGDNGSVINNKDVVEDMPSLDSNGAPIVKGAGTMNMLICGLDEGETLTDIIMVAQVDLDNKTVKVLQIPRDTYIASGVSATNKINSAYGGGDASLTPINRLIKVINEQYQLKIDHYATVTISSFRKIVDAIGGVPIDMPYQVGNNELGIIYKGQQVLDGEHAEWLVRHRHTYYDQDIGRIKVQRLFLAAALAQVKTIGIKEVASIIPAVYGNLTTDLTMAEMKNYSSLAFSVSMDNVDMFLVPGEGVNYKGQSLWTTHLYETADLLNRYFRPTGTTVAAEKLKITELAHTGEYYENTQDNLQNLVDGEKPGQQKEDDLLPAYSHVVTQPAPVTTAPPETSPLITETLPVGTTVTTDTGTTDTTDTTTTTTTNTTISESGGTN